MKKYTGVTRILESRQELFPDFSEEFPYVASLARIDSVAGGVVPWHWHEAVELFYIESGCLEYETPGQKLIFPAGSGGFVNAGVLHATRSVRAAGEDETVQLLHIFEPSFIAGARDGVVAKRYVQPVVTRPDFEILSICPHTPQQRALLALLRASFELDENALGYELKLRATLSELWLRLLPLIPGAKRADFSLQSDQMRRMMRYVQEHYAEKISVAELAAAVPISERECYRLFQKCLHCSPVAYIISYRLDMAGRLLAHSDASITEISQTCGFGSSSYFTRVFGAHFGCMPSQYRKRWQDSANVLHE